MSAEATDFYITGGTLQYDAPSYVERRADSDLFEALTRGEFCYVLTSRQMGKSSLMIHTAARLREAGIAVAVLDLTAIGQNLSSEQWYDGLRELLGISLELEDELDDFWRDHRRLGPLQRWMAALRQVVLAKVPGQVVIFVDEIDAVRSLPFSTDEFFSGVRECYNHRTQEPEYARLVFCLLGVASPADLISDTRTSPFNIGRRIELTDFTATEAAPLTRGLQRDQRQRHEEHEEKQWFKPSRGTLLDRVLYWTGGQPYLTQRLCRAIAEDGQAATPADVNRLCAGLFLTRKAQEVDDNLAFVRNRLLRAEVDLAGLLELYRQVQWSRRVLDDETNPLVTVLRLAGVVRTAGGVLQVRNRIYDRVFDQEWVVAHMPDAELRRQRAAYHRGLVRASALAAVMLALVGSLAFTAASQAARAQRGERQARREALHAQTSAEEARRLAARLQIALREKEGAFTRLRASLAAEQTQRQRAGQAAEQARQAERRERAQRLQADAARTEAEQQRQVAVIQREAAVHARAQAITERRRAEQETRRAQRHLYFANMNLAPQHWESANVARLRQLLEETRGNPERGFEWAYWQRLRHLELQTLRGHTAGVHAVAFSPDGRRVVTGSDDKTAKVWDAETGRELLTLRGHLLPIGSVAFSPDGRRIATGSFDTTAMVWDTASGRLLRTLKGHTNNVTAVAFSLDGRRLLTGSWDGTARLWDAETGSQILALPGPDDLLAVAFSADGRRLLTARMPGGVRIWEAATGRMAADFPTSHGGNVQAAAFSPDGRRIVTGSDDSTAKVWDAETGRQILTLPAHTAGIRAVAFSPDGERIVTGSDDTTAKVWDAASGRLLRTLKGHSSNVTAVALSPDGRHLLTGSDDHTARVWDAAHERVTLPLLGGSGMVRSVAVSPDGRRMVTATRGDLAARVWDAATGRPTLALQGHTAPVWCVAFSPDGRRIATGSLDRTARVWDATTGRSLFTLRGHTGWVTAVAFSLHGGRLLTASWDQTAKVWDLATGREIATLIGQGTRISSAALSPDGRRLLLGSQDDGTAKLWDLRRGRELLSLAGHPGGAASVAFSPDGGRLLTGGQDQTAKVWDAASGDELLTLRGHTGAVTAVAFSPDGRRLVTASADATAKVWDAASGRETLTLKGQTAPIRCVAFSADGRLILTGGEDGTVQVWQAASPPQIAAWSTAERATEREQQERAAREAARNALQVVASSRGGAIRLQWRPVPGAVGYRLSRAPADAPRARWVPLTARPVPDPVFTDRGPGLAPGRPLAYTVTSLVQRGGKLTEGPQVTLQANPVTLPSGWTGSSINEGGLSGSAVFHPATREITLRGSGALAGGPADEAYFLNQPVTGDFQITVRMLTTPTMTHLVARAGLMIRESLAAGARMAHLTAVPIRMSWLEWRPTANGNLSGRLVIGSDQFKLPLTLRLIRRGDTLRAESSLDEGKSFQPTGDPLRFTPPLPPTLYVGLAICSLDANQRSEATFRDLTIEKLSGDERP